MKRFIAIISLFLCLACADEEPTASDLIDYIPRKSSVIIKTPDLEKLLSQTKSHELLKQFKTTKYGQKLNSYGALLANFSSEQESLITFTQLGRDDFEISFISKQVPKPFLADSSKFSVQKLNATTPAITKVTVAKESFYTIRINNIFIASSSQLLLENSIREKETFYREDKSFIKAYNASSSKTIASILIKGNETGNLWSTVFPKAQKNPFKNAFSWIQADLNLDKSDLKYNGVVIVKDSTQQHLELLKNINPQVNKVAQITPLSARGATSLTYDSWQTFKNNLANFKKIDPSKFSIPKEELLTTFNEISLITMEDTQAIVATSLDPELTQLELSSEQEQVSTFRQVPFYQLEDNNINNAFTKAFSTILSLPKVKYYCILDNFYLFAGSQNTLEAIVANYQNKAVFAASKSYQNLASQLSKSSSLLLISNTSQIPFNTMIVEKEAKKVKAISLDNYPFAALQLVQDNGFMHLQAIINKNKSISQAGTVVQIASTKLDNDILMTPKLVKNHRTKGMDIVLQDQANQLYLLSNNGKILWKKQLESPIIGEIQQIDMYRNGRLQLVFNTASTFYILDRNGKEVAPFPIKFKNTITQPLAIFDYEKNRNYRFLITQTDQVTMYDKTAKKVSGFGFTKAKSEIILPPKHLRIDTKDYITIAESSGVLNILNRVGESRINVTDPINFGHSNITKEETKFVTYDTNGSKISINASGKVSTTATEYGTSTTITANNKTNTCIRENNLYINAKKITIPYGSYTAPTINTIKGKSYISFTNTESNKVYLYDNSGNSLDNFPVYGTTPSSVGHLERNKGLGLVTQGDARTVLLYKIK